MICILDTKWKLIDENKIYANGSKDKKKSIKQSDVYQLFAYGKKYSVPKVILVYPQWANFQQSFSFKLDENLTLNICPFKL